MTINVTTRSADGFESSSAIRSFSVNIDPTGEMAPDTLESLLAAYGACFIPALRVGAEKYEINDLGTVEIDITGDRNENDKLEAVSFEISTDAGLDAEVAIDVIDTARSLCKVHAALRPDLRATVTIDGHEID